MTKPLALLASVIVVVALAAPSDVEAQAQRRGGGSSDSGGSSSDGGGSRGGDSGGGGSVAMPRGSSPQPSPAPAVRERPSRPASVDGSATRSSGSRPGAEPDSRIGPAARSASQGSATMRVRSSQAVRGVAQPRTNVVGPNPPRSPNSWSRWSPWYGYGYGYSYGYGPGYYGQVVYNPWIYGGSSIWPWNRYAWHDPFLYEPYGYAGYPYYWSTDIDRDADRDQGMPTGALRLRVNPGHARVYIDGALAGVASEFGGLSNHLALPVGVHEIELRADGYSTYSGQVNVRGNRTQTERINLKKQ